jgi:predicted TIM-barrel fold metal-dependent hydrolase
MIIDVHVHTRSPGHRYDPDEIATSIRLARQAGIDHVVQLHNLVGHPANTEGFTALSPSPTVVQQSNDLAMRIVAEHPDFYSGFCYLNPAHESRFILAEIERCVVAGNLRGIKLWIAVHATDARLDPLMQRAAELEIPVLHHAWYKADGQTGNESTAAEIADLARRHPRVSIIMAHLGGVRWRGVLDIKPYRNVVVDTSGAQPVAGLVEYAVAQLGPERVVFGSDWPLRNYAVQKARVSGAKLSEGAKACILGENAARLLHLDRSPLTVTTKEKQYA